MKNGMQCGKTDGRKGGREEKESDWDMYSLDTDERGDLRQEEERAERGSECWWNL